MDKYMFLKPANIDSKNPIKNQKCPRKKSYTAETENWNCSEYYNLCTMDVRSFYGNVVR